MNFLLVQIHNMCYDRWPKHARNTLWIILKAVKEKSLNVYLSVIAENGVGGLQKMEHIKIFATFLTFSSVILLGCCAAADLEIKLEIETKTTINIPDIPVNLINDSSPDPWHGAMNDVSFSCNYVDGFQLVATMDNNGKLKTRGGTSLQNPLNIKLPGGQSTPLNNAASQDYEAGPYPDQDIEFTQDVVAADLGGLYSGTVNIIVSYGADAS